MNVLEVAEAFRYDITLVRKAYDNKMLDKEDYNILTAYITLTAWEEMKDNHRA